MKTVPVKTEAASVRRVKIVPVKTVRAVTTAMIAAPVAAVIGIAGLPWIVVPTAIVDPLLIVAATGIVDRHRIVATGIVVTTAIAPPRVTVIADRLPIEVSTAIVDPLQNVATGIAAATATNATGGQPPRATETVGPLRTVARTVVVIGTVDAIAATANRNA